MGKIGPFDRIDWKVDVFATTSITRRWGAEGLSRKGNGGGGHTPDSASHPAAGGPPKAAQILKRENQQPISAPCRAAGRRQAENQRGGAQSYDNAQRGHIELQRALAHRIRRDDAQDHRRGPTTLG